MTRVSLLGAIAVLSAVTATPALAQRMIEEPGAYAFYHPNADLGIGSARPAMDAMAMAPPRTMHHLMGARPRNSASNRSEARPGLAPGLSLMGSIDHEE